MKKKQIRSYYKPQARNLTMQDEAVEVIHSKKYVGQTNTTALTVMIKLTQIYLLLFICNWSDAFKLTVHAFD